MKKDDLLRALFLLLLLLPIHIHLSQCASSFLILIAGKNQPCANREQSAAQPLTTTHGSMSVAAQQVVHDTTTRQCANWLLGIIGGAPGVTGSD